MPIEEMIERRGKEEEEEEQEDMESSIFRAKFTWYL